MIRLGNSILNPNSFQILLQEIIDKEHEVWPIIQMLEVQHQRQKDASVDERLRVLHDIVYMHSQELDKILGFISTAQYGSDHDSIQKNWGRCIIIQDSGSWKVKCS